MIDRYTKFILTVIAGALLYLAVILTPLPRECRRPRNTRAIERAHCRSWSLARGLPQAVMPVSFSQPVEVTASTAAAGHRPGENRAILRPADRVVLVGWEEGPNRDKRAPDGDVQRTRIPTGGALPVQQLPK